MLEARHISVCYGTGVAVADVSLRVEAGQWLMLVGPNGAGKSTLLEALAQCVPYTGQVLWAGTDARELSPAAWARRVGVLSQRHQLSFDYTVEEIVRLGRYAHRGSFFTRRDEEGDAKVEEALLAAGMERLRHKSILRLSGGEVQRAFLAQVFAQNPQLLLLDEPVNYLDLPYQKQIFSLLEVWLRESGRAIISVVHDLSIARRYGTHALLLHDGRCAAQGISAEVFTPEALEAVYHMDVGMWMRKMLRVWAE